MRIDTLKLCELLARDIEARASGDATLALCDCIVDAVEADAMATRDWAAWAAANSRGMAA
jgi:hypothetical protein